MPPCPPVPSPLHPPPTALTSSLGCTDQMAQRSEFIQPESNIHCVPGPRSSDQNERKTKLLPSKDAHHLPRPPPPPPSEHTEDEKHPSQILKFRYLYLYVCIYVGI